MRKYNPRSPHLAWTFNSLMGKPVIVPPQAADDKVVVIRDGQATAEGLVLAASLYMGAVKDIFKLRDDGPPFNERSVLKDTGALRAFDHLDACSKALRQAITHFAPTDEPIEPVQASAVPDVKEMVNRFLSWRLPNDFAPDAGISFNPGPTQHLPHCWPTGTCLFTAAQAEQMIRYMLRTAAEGASGGC